MYGKNYYSGFPSLSALATVGALAQTGYKWLSRGGYGRYSVTGNDRGAQRRTRMKMRYGSRTKTRTKKRFKRTLRRKLRRVQRSMKRKGLNAIETKYMESSNYNLLVAKAMGTAANVGLATDIDRGTDVDERVGRKVFIRHVNLKAHFIAGPDGLARAEQYIRIMVIRWNAVPDTDKIDWTLSANQPSVLDIMVNPIPGDVDAQMTPFKRMDGKWSNPYTILYNKLVKVSNESGGDHEQHVISKRIPVMKSCHWASSGVEGTNGVGPGHITIHAFCNETAGTSPTAAFAWRTSFTDC